MRFGGVSTTLTTMVGTAVFAAIVTKFGLDGRGNSPTTPCSQSLCGSWVCWAVLVLSVAAPALSALYTFRHDAQDAAAHQISAAGYAGVLTHLTIFLARYERPDLTAEKEDEAVQSYDQVMTEYRAVLEKSITLTNDAYRSADRKMQESEGTTMKA